VYAAQFGNMLVRLGRGPFRVIRVVLTHSRSLPVFPCRSAGRCNTGVKSLCWGFKLQGLTWSFV
jgi:hypothetical protein